MPRESKEFSTFEVTLPHGVNSDTLALYGLGNALGWNITERVALPSDLLSGDTPKYMEITPDDLEGISEELWDTEVYGQNAARFLDEDRRNVSKQFHVYTTPAKEEGLTTVHSDLAWRFGLRRGEDRYNSTLGTYRRSRRGSAEAEEIAHLVARVWSVTPYPFETPTVRKRRRPEPGSDDERTTYWELEPGVVSRVRLAHDARLSGTARHTVGGAIGKTLDVMNVAAGLADKTEIKAKPMETEDLEFVDYAEFRDTLRHSDLTRHAQSKIRGAIDFNLAEQIRRGKGWSRGGQIVVEGAGGWVSRGGNRVPHFEKIARFSLAHLLDHEGLTRSRAPREFLAQFAD